MINSAVNCLPFSPAPFKEFIIGIQRIPIEA
jgi:hypothetical protein